MIRFFRTQDTTKIFLGSGARFAVGNALEENEMKSQSLLRILVALQLSGCVVTQNNRPDQLDEDLDVKSSIGNTKVALDDEGDVVLHTENDAPEELRTQQWINRKQEDDIEHELIELKQCRTDLADKRLGGDGSVEELPEIDDMQAIDDVREKFAIDAEGNLKLVKKEYFLERLKKERDYGHSLATMKKTIAKYNDSCQRKMGAARLATGLPARRYEAQGYFTSDGVWVGREKAERSLDDAFERAAKAEVKRESKAELP
jgi:hypothetical protein